MSTNQIGLDTMRILMEVVDDFCDVMAKAKSVFDKHTFRLDLMQKVDTSDQEIMKQVLAGLPPDRVTALVLALVDLAKLVPADAPDPKTQLENFDNFLNNLHKIQSNLHLALDGKPQ